MCADLLEVYRVTEAVQRHEQAARAGELLPGFTTALAPSPLIANSTTTKSTSVTIVQPVSTSTSNPSKG